MESIDKKILQEIKRHQSINRYITEQNALPPEDPNALPAPPMGDAPMGAEPPAEPAAPEMPPPQPIDPETDPDVEKIDNGGESEEGVPDGGDSEELDISDLVNTQKEIGEKQDNYFDQLFQHLDNLETKLSEMDVLMDKVNSLEEKIEKYRPKTPQEKLELRSLDSGPYNQKLSDFFSEKEPEMERSGKNEYVLTTDDVENFSPSEIRNTFVPEPKKNFGI